ncbi:hypothetical protein BD769DRAFT_1664759 [Suillus cothurnatus]|nr:hypothetical protein BD769DRAFT_1664759 [Suillus cothurnatus]
MVLLGAMLRTGFWGPCRGATWLRSKRQSVIVPAAPAIPVLGPAKNSTAPDPNLTILLPAQPTPTMASAGVVQGAAAEVPNDVEILPVVAAAPSSGHWGQGRQVGMLAPVSSGPAGQLTKVIPEKVV